MLSREAICDQLRDHRVVADPDLVTLFDAGIHPDVVREPQPLDLPALGEERLRVLRIEPHLDGVPARLLMLERELPASRDPKLLLDEVDPCDELGDRVLDLDAAVQLEEEKLAVCEHQLDGAGAAVADRAREGDRRLFHPPA